MNEKTLAEPAAHALPPGFFTCYTSSSELDCPHGRALMQYHEATGTWTPVVVNCDCGYTHPAPNHLAKLRQAGICDLVDDMLCWVCCVPLAASSSCDDAEASAPAVTSSGKTMRTAAVVALVMVAIAAWVALRR